MYVSCIIVVRNQSVEKKVKEAIKKLPIYAGAGLLVKSASDLGPQAQSAFSSLTEDAVVCVAGQGAITEAFRQVVLPIFYEIGTCIFFCSVAYGFYYLMRKNVKEATGRLKWAAIGYICLKCMEVFARLVDNVAIDILKRMQ